MLVEIMGGWILEQELALLPMVGKGWQIPKDIKDKMNIGY